jgi:hypothetical protein
LALSDNGDGSFRLISSSSNRALAVSGGSTGASTADDASYVQTTCAGKASQRFELAAP